jgi:hypothetical protein
MSLYIKNRKLEKKLSMIEKEHKNTYNKTSEDNNNNGAISKIKKYKDEHKFKYYLIITSIILALIAIIAAIIPISINTKRENLYKDLKLEMEYFDQYSLYTIDDLLNKLPSNYKDVSTITTQYKLIKKQVKTLNSCTDLASWNFQEGTCDKIRRAYAELTLYCPLYYDWNLEDYLANIKLEMLIFDGRWQSNTTSNYFEWESYKNIGDQRLLANIPNNKQDDKEYFYTTDQNVNNIVFGYTSKDNPEEKFNAFRVSNLRYINNKFMVDVYCYSLDTKQVFTLLDFSLSQNS